MRLASLCCTSLITSDARRALANNWGRICPATELQSGFAMTGWDRILQRVRGGNADASLRFDDLRGLLLSLGFSERSRGSHHIFTKAGVSELINLQRDGANAKPYQVRQVRLMILKYNLESRA